MDELSDLTSQCIRCGFCLEACPTFQITADETKSPRGRITLVKEAELAGAYDAATEEALDTCLGCRACEPACPSGVQYGAILELARARLPRKTQSRLRQGLIRTLSDHRTARLQMTLAHLLPGDRTPDFVSYALSGQAPEADLPAIPNPIPWPDLDERTLPPVRGEVYLLEGCVMRVLYPDVHEATRRLLRRVGLRVRPAAAGCCGALAAHAGYLDDAERKAQRLARDLPGDLPVVVNAAGCGSTLKEYGHVIGQGLTGFARRVVDATEFLAREGLADALRGATGLPGVTLTYHDACHLAHGQRITSAPRTLLDAVPGLTRVDLPESEMCCGSAGTYNVFQPALARQLLTRKWDHIAGTGAHVVAMGNPGCQAWIAQAQRESRRPIRVMHTLDVLESAFSGLRPEE